MRILSLFTLVFCFLFSQHAFSQCDHPDYDALMEFYDSADGENWHSWSFEGWKEGKAGTSCDPCLWEGVSCNEDDRVTELALSDYVLSGNIPDLQLSELTILELTSSFLTGPIPDFTGMPKLKWINLWNSKLTGDIPNFSNLPELELIQATGNQFDGTLPLFDKCLKLESIRINRTSLKGELPNFNLPALKDISLCDNDLEGSLPLFQNCPQLTRIEISSNRLSGSIPDLNLPLLTTLDLKNNLIVSPINILSGCPNLTSYSLNENQLTGEFPDFSPHPNYKSLAVSFPLNFLSGCYPASMCELDNVNLYGNLDLPFQGGVETFCIGNQQIGAPCGGWDNTVISSIQEDCSCEMVPCDDFHPDLEMLLSLYNALDGDNWDENLGWKEANEGLVCDPCRSIGTTGAWPGIQCQNDRVICINLDGMACYTDGDGNNLNGVLPNLISDKLEQLVLANNLISGQLPDLSGLTGLEILDLSNNQIIDTIALSKLPGTLEELMLHGNQLGGTLPEFNFHSLTILNLSFNNFSGLFPSFNLPELEDLFISNNNFEGPLPDFSSVNSLQKIQFFAENNNFTGCYSDVICQMWKVELAGNIELPFFGIDFDRFCSGQDQLGAPCGEVINGVSNYIKHDCSCSPICESDHPDLAMLMSLYDALDGENWFQKNGWEAAASGVTCNPCVNYDFVGPWDGVHCNEAGRVVCIDMDGIDDCTSTGSLGNNLKGVLPALQSEHLESLILDGNNLSGSNIDLSGLPNLQSLLVSQCQLNGPLPNFDGLSLFKEFRGSYNNFTGPLPDIDTMDSLRTFTVFNNNLTGCFKSAYCNLELFDARENYEMPWEGDHILFCNGENEIDAPCSMTGATGSFAINEDCVCVLTSSTHDNLETGFSIYPNPATHNIKITSLHKSVHYTIFDIHGQNCASGNLEDDAIPVGFLPAGAYFIKWVGQDGQSGVARFVKI